MIIFINRYSILCLAGIWLVFGAVSPQIGYTQHLGDPLLFQGMVNENNPSASAAAYGNAFTSRSRDLSALFFNPAGLAGIQSMQFSLNVSSSSNLWRDNQEWYPGTDYTNVNLLLDGLWTPDPAHNGIWSDSLIYTYYNSQGEPIGASWNVGEWKEPVMGQDKYSSEASENEYKTSDLGLDQISAAVPINFGERSIVAAVSLVRKFNINNYDWNGTHLDPAWTTSDIIIAEPEDTVRTNWSVFTRNRKGNIYGINAAIGVELTNHFLLGVGFNRFAGETTEDLNYDRVGYISTIHQESQWAFSYDNHVYSQVGTSKFSSFSVNFGGLLQFENLSAGFNIKLPSTIEREWDYSITDGPQTNSLSGVDKVNLPAEFRYGISFSPFDKFSMSFDLEQKPYSNTNYDLANTFPDTLTQYNKWVDQTAYKVGLEYRFIGNLSLLAGYIYQTTAFVPYGAAFRDRGTPGETYTAGLSFRSIIGRFDLAFLYYKLRYYDAFFGNVNYTLHTTQRILLGYTFEL